MTELQVNHPSVFFPQIWRVVGVQAGRERALRGQEVLQALRQLALVGAPPEVLQAVLAGAMQERYVSPWVTTAATVHHYGICLIQQNSDIPTVEVIALLHSKKLRYLRVSSKDCSDNTNFLFKSTSVVLKTLPHR